MNKIHFGLFYMKLWLKQWVLTQNLALIFTNQNFTHQLAHASSRLCKTSAVKRHQFHREIHNYSILGLHQDVGKKTLLFHCQSASLAAVFSCLQEKIFHNCYTYKIAHRCNTLGNTIPHCCPIVKDSRSLESQRSSRPHAQWRESAERWLWYASWISGCR